MLVLTRKKNETILIGDDIAVTVVQIENGQVRLGITAPRQTRVDRTEVAARKKANPYGSRTVPPVTDQAPEG